MVRSPYKGALRQLSIAFDIGTTYSGMSYCVCEPGNVPKTINVTRFPGQEHVAGSAKIPSIMFYDKKGAMMAAGAETSLDENIELFETEEWTKVEWFKLRLRPQSMPSELRNAPLDPLPPNATLTTVFADFMAYLLQCTKKFFEESSPNGATQWANLIDTAHFIISHPNGWEGPQQTKLRKAAVLALLVPDTMEGRARIHFVTEGEASLHFCLNEKVIEEGVDANDNGFIIADLGGGTLDFSSYKVTGLSPLIAEETAATKCALEGSALVTIRATAYLKDKLAMSERYGTTEHINNIAKKFDDTTKRRFRGSKEPCLIQFGSPADKDIDFGIRGGNLKLAGNIVAEFFDPSVEAAVQAINEMVEDSKTPISSVYLVGGFSASPYLVTELKKSLGESGITVSVPDGQTAKAVADGAISFFIDHYVFSRVAKVSYGTDVLTPFQSTNPEHKSRAAYIYTDPSGSRLLPDSFNVAITKGTLIHETTTFRKSLCKLPTNFNAISCTNLDVIAYTGPGKAPNWIDVDAANFKTLLKLRADTSDLQNSLRKQRGPNGQTYWLIVFEYAIHFGLTEIKAELIWKENGIEKRSEAQVIYDEMLEDEEEEEEVSDRLAKLTTTND